MVGASILPACVHKGQIFFLFGKERDIDSTPGWSDFGGGVDPGETPYQTAIREGGEELTGFLGNVGNLLRKHGVYRMLYESDISTYHVHIFPMEYDPALVQYYNNNQKFIQGHLSPHVIKNSKIFEKAEIRWVPYKDLHEMRPKFRSFYRHIVDMLLERRTEITRFVRGNGA